MINVNVIVWLLAGGVIGWLVMLQNHFSMAPLLGSFIAAVVLLTIFSLIRRQPIR
jgi:hypothetical protein